MKSIIKLLEVIIWPATILIIIYWFRTPFRSVFGRLKNIDASATGISMSFQEKVDAAKKKAMSITNNAIAKSGPQINTSNNKDKLKGLGEKLLVDLKALASKNNVDVNHNDANKLIKDLKRKGILQFEHAELIDSFLDLTKDKNANPNDSLLEDVNVIYKTIQDQLKQE